MKKKNKDLENVSGLKNVSGLEDVSVADFVDEKLFGANYFVWKSKMLSLLERYGLVGFIIKDELTPDDDENTAEMVGIEGVVRTWILSTVDENILPALDCLKTSEAMWALLHRRYSDTAKKSHIYSGYLPLAKAVLNNDWDKATEFIEQQPDSVRANITGFSETALMIAVRSVWRINFVKHLVAIMSDDDVALANDSGSTALHMAASNGNLEAAKLLVDRNGTLTHRFNVHRLLPLHEAAQSGHKEMSLYLLNHMEMGSLDNEAAGQLLNLLISSEFYDLALSLVQRYPTSAFSHHAPLLSLTRKFHAFPSGAKFNLWQRIVYSGVPVTMENEENHRSRTRDIENNASTSFISVRGKMYQLFWKVAEKTVPLVKSMRDKKLIHYQAQHLLKQLVGEVIKLDFSQATELLTYPFTEGAAMGVNEVVEEILEMYPGAIYFTNVQEQTIFHIAIINRREKVFNIIYQLGERSQNFMTVNDASLTNALHLVSRFGNDQMIKLRASAAGAALQMQRELQWFKEVERLTGSQNAKNIDFERRTAVEVFSETHQELVKEGEVWMKGTANSCAIVAALIVTIIFAAAITVPGGNNSNTGLPFFAKRNAFIVFAISDVLALFSSTSSLLMFLSILTSRYSEGDFLYSLPKRLIIGLTTLFLSIIFMMITFTAAVEVLFGDISSWILGSVIALASIPIMLFMSLQFSLLVDMIKSTYGSGIFGRQSDHILY